MAFRAHHRASRFDRSRRAAAVLVSTVLAACLLPAASLVYSHELPKRVIDGEPSQAWTDALLDLAAQYEVASPGDKGRVANALLTAAARRHAELAALIEDDPAAVINAALPASIRSKMPANITPYLEQDTEADGSLQIIHEHVGDTARYRYWLDTAQGRYALHLPAQRPRIC